MKDTGAFIRYYLFDIQMLPSQNFRNTASIGSSVNDYINLHRPLGKAELFDVVDNNALFSLPQLRPQSIDDISVTVQRRFQVTTSGAGAASLSLSATGETFANVNVNKEPIPVVPTVHYNMGGIPTNYKAEVLTLNGSEKTVPGLMAIGEAACVSVHGANRLGSNSLIDLVVFGRAAAKRAAELIKPGMPHEEVSKSETDKCLDRFDKIRNSNGSTMTSAKIIDPGQGYSVGDSLSFTPDPGGDAVVTCVVDAVGETLGGIPIASLNGTFTAIKEIGIDSFCITPDVSSYDFKSGYTAPVNTLSGGSNVTSSRNYYFDTLHTMIPSLQFKNTRIYSSVYMAPMQSPEGFANGTNHVKKTVTEFVTLNDNVHFDSPHVVASAVNESAYNGGSKSFTCQLQLQSFNSNLSPVIDVGTLGAIGIMNRLNNIDSATSKKVDGVTNSLPDGTVYVASTEPEGDNNAMVYCTRKVNLKTPATALRVTADLFKPATTDIKFMYKILKNDESQPWDDLGWEFFNTDGSPDSTLESDARNFKEYDYSAEALPEFSAFSIKVVGQGTNTCEIPLVAALRCIALAT